MPRRDGARRPRPRSPPRSCHPRAARSAAARHPESRGEIPSLPAPGGGRLDGFETILPEPPGRGAVAEMDGAVGGEPDARGAETVRQAGGQRTVDRGALHERSHAPREDAIGGERGARGEHERDRERHGQAGGQASPGRDGTDGHGRRLLTVRSAFRIVSLAARRPRSRPAEGGATTPSDRVPRRSGDSPATGADDHAPAARRSPRAFRTVPRVA